MAGFRRKERRGMPEMNTSSLPDLIFTILFFFMMVTTMREVTLKVKFTIPAGTELEKLEKKSVVSFIYVGPPTDNLRAQMGSSTRIQLNDRFAEAKEVMDFVAAERQGMTNQAEHTSPTSKKYYVNPGRCVSTTQQPRETDTNPFSYIQRAVPPQRGSRSLSYSSPCFRTRRGSSIF